MAATTDNTQTQDNSSFNITPQQMAVLQQLVQQGQPAMSMVGANGQPAVGNAQGQQIGPYQKGVTKALQEAGYAHTNQAIQSGVPVDFIQNHPLATGQPGGQQQPPMSTPQGINPAGAQMLQQGQQQINPQQILQGLTQQGQQTQGFNANNALQILQQKAMDIEGQKPGILGSLFPGIAESRKATQLQNVGTAEKLAAGQPAEIAEPQARAGLAKAQTGYYPALSQQAQAEAALTNANAAYQNLKNQGREPLQQKDYIEAYASIAPKFYDALSAGIGATGKMGENATSLFNSTSANTRTLLQRWQAKPSDSSAKALTAALGTQQAGIDAIHDYMRTMGENNPAQVLSNLKNKISMGNAKGETTPNPAEAMAMKIKGAVGFDTDLNAWVDSNGKVVK